MESQLNGKPCILECRPRLFRVFSQVLNLAIFLLCFAQLASAQTIVDIHAIAVDLPASPYLGQTVYTKGIVIAVLSDGFYIENPSSDFDQNTCSSEGIYVYTPSGVPSNAVSGNSLTVYGVVEASNASSHAGVQIYIASPVVGTNVITNSAGNALPSAISSSVMTQATGGVCPDYPAGTFGQWLPFEGMRVNVPSSSYLLVTQGTGGTVTPASANATSNGQFWAVFTDTASTSNRPARSTGISELDAVPSTAPSTVQRWTGNPQLLLVDTTTLGGTALDASATTVYSGASSMVGIVDYHVSAEGYTGLLLTSDSVSALSKQGGATPTAATTRGSDEITIATQNLESAPGVGLTEAEASRIAKLANAIVNYHKSPDILAVQDATSAALADLVSAIGAAGGPSYTLLAGGTNLSDNMVDAFLVNASKFDGTPAVGSTLASARYTTTSSTTATLFDRVPLVLTVKIARKGISDYVLSIVDASLQERTNIDDASLGPDIRNRRAQQAEQLTTLVLEPMEAAGSHFMVVGGFDSFEFSDGFVDALGILDGSEAADTTANTAGDLVTLYDTTFNTAALINTTTTATNLTASATNPTTSRYTFVENGSAEQPDHILVSPEMAGLASIDYARIGADFPVSETYDTSTVARASSHDSVISYFTIPYPTTTTLTGAPNPSYYDEPVTFTATVAVTGSTVTNVPDGTVTFYDTDGITKLGSATLNSSGVATFTYSSLAVGAHTIHASYGGSETGLGYQASSTAMQQTVIVDVASLALTGSANPSYLGQPVTLTATASNSNGAGGTGNTPSGTVTFTDMTNSATLGSSTLSSGVAALTIATLSIGTHLIQATYGGDATNSSSTSNTVSQVLVTNGTVSTVTSSLNPSYYGDSVTFAVSEIGSYGTPTGTVTFLDATTSTKLDTETLAAASGVYAAAATSKAIAALSIGSHTIQTIYGGDGTNAAVTGSVVQVVNTNTTALTLVSSNNPSYFGDNVEFTVTAVGASGIPSGTVAFYYGTTALGSGTLTAATAANTASATFSTSALPVGTDAVQAIYGGVGVHATGTSNTVSQVVEPVYTPVSTLSCSPNPAEYGATVTCTDSLATAAGQPSGTATFYDGTTALGTALVTTGTATFSTSSLAVGSHAITAVYARNGAYQASTSNVVTELIVSTFSLSATPASATVYTGEAVNSSITVTPGSGFTLDVALACSGLPANTTCTLTPATVTGGSGTAKLVVQTTAPSLTTKAMDERSPGHGWRLLAGLFLLLVPKRLRRQGRWLMGLLLIATLAVGALSGCGGSGTLAGGTPAGSYTVTVTGTATVSTMVLIQSTTVTVKVQSLF
jgi:hypothetical protein